MHQAQIKTGRIKSGLSAVEVDMNLVQPGLAYIVSQENMAM
jgi:hypothetical protein